MRYRILGSTGLEVSEIGYGTWGLGGNSYGPVDDNESKKTLKLAFEKGINFYDTSDLYGDGHSEELLSEVFKNTRDKVIVATKGGTLPHTGFYMPQDFSPKHLKNALEGSLQRLKTDYIDLYQLHSPKIEDIENNESVIQLLEGFQKEGKIRAYGISVRSPDDGKIAIEKYHFPVVQVNFNMIDQRAIENGLFALAREREVGIIVRTPLVFGYLTGKLDGNEQFQGIDHRANWPKEQLQRWAKAPNLFSFLYEGKDRTPAQTALRFCLEHDGVSTVIPGMMNINEVRENTEASDMSPLTDEEMERIRRIYQDHDFYDKSAKHKSRG
jgi:aryl-alcohol dehydrogenase-like predicted oxidoreductase